MTVRSFCAGFLLMAGAAFGQVNMLYVPDNSSNLLAGFTLSGGTLTAAGSPATNNLPWDVAVTPDGKFVYVADGGGFVDAYSVTTAGAISLVGSSLAGASLTGIAVDAGGKFLYVSDSTGGGRIVSFTINQTTGALTPLTTTADIAPKGMVVDANNHLYVARGSGAGIVEGYTINGTTGALSAIGGGAFTTNSANPPNRVAVNAAGTLLITSNTFDSSVTVMGLNPSTGAPTSATPVTIASSFPFGLAINPAGNVLLVTDFGGSRVFAFSISGTTLTPAAGSPFATGSSPAGVTIDPAGGFAFVANSGAATISRFSVGAGGVLSSLGTSSAGGSAPEFLVAHAAPFVPVSTVPTLSTWSFVLLGMLLAGSSIVMYRRSYR